MFRVDSVVVMIKINVMVAALVCCAAAMDSSSDERLVVTTEEGSISGIKAYSSKGRSFYTFHSIPFAKPPVGELRFKDPVPSEGWVGVLDGAIRAPSCTQASFLPLTLRELVLEGEEDCLYLSVYSPMPLDHKKRLPVMVFIHGGGFFAGGGDFYNGNVLMNEDVVLVLVQYRLGLLGFLSTEDSVMPGNYGLKDQTLALQWIQKNINHFRGDAARVTLFGESAGGASVHFHLLSPYSHDLFARGIMMSGTLFSPWAMGGAFRDVAQYTAKLFGCRNNENDVGGQSSESLLFCLQNVDAKNLTATLMDHMIFAFNPVLMGPRIDGDYLPAETEVLMTEGRHKRTDIISGVTAHEGGLLALPLYSSEAIKSDLLSNFEEIGPASLDLAVGDEAPAALARKIFNHYLGGVKVDKADADNICQLFGDRHFKLGHDQVSALFTKNMATHKVYLYNLDHRGQRSLSQFYDTDVGEKWVSHVDDLFYLFTGGPVWSPLERDEDLKLRDIIVKLWINFASTGNPTPDDSLGFTWQPAAPDHLQHLSLTPLPSMKNDQRKEIRAFWESLPTRQNMILNPDKVVHLPERYSDHQRGSKSSPLLVKLPKWKVRDEL